MASHRTDKFLDEDWLTDPEFSEWISGIPGDGIAYCKLCKSEISVLSGIGALRAHAKGKRHNELLFGIPRRTTNVPYQSFNRMSCTTTETSEVSFGVSLPYQSSNSKRNAGLASSSTVAVSGDQDVISKQVGQVLRDGSSIREKSSTKIPRSRQRVDRDESDSFSSDSEDTSSSDSE